MAEAAGVDEVAIEELRIAGVLNGGVSLAVWMGGAAHELNRLTRCVPSDGDVAAGSTYSAVVQAARTRALVDVLAGTSAGGINGGALAIAQLNSAADLSVLRSLWSEQGRLQSLLRRPFQGNPTSLLRGDEYFLPQLAQAMHGLLEPFASTNRYVDLVMPTTLLEGTTLETPDAFGQIMRQQVFGGTFNFGLSFPAPGTAQDSDNGRTFRTEVAAAIALAARASAGFPFAFEPTYIPVDDVPGRSDADLRPDMGRWASWHKAGQNRSRFAMDGGVLANTPTRQALAAIERRGAHGPVRRVMLVVHPHAAHETVEVRQLQDEPPTVTGAALDLFGALRSQGSRSFVEEIDDHNRRVGAWRGGRDDVLTAINASPGGGSVRDLYDLVRVGWPSYRLLRQRLSAATLAGRVTRATWSFERIRRQAESVQVSQPDAEHLGYLPSAPPPAAVALGLRDSEQGVASLANWPWGPVVARGIAEAAADVLRRSLSVATAEEERELGPARLLVGELEEFMVALSDDVDALWTTPDVLQLDLVPDAGYWEARLIAFRRAMGTVHDVDAARLAELLPTSPWLAARILERSTTYGIRFATCVWETATALSSVLEIVLRVSREPRGELAGLDKWRPLLTLAEPVDGEPEGEIDRLLMRLLALDTATWLIANADGAGNHLPINMVQLSLAVDHPFATRTTSPALKAAGLSLGHFGGFLKRSWRLNDWTWGRLDAARMLCEIVLEPGRLLRIGELTGGTPEQRADRVLDRLVLEYGPTEPTDSQYRDLHDRAKTELTALFGAAASQPSSLPSTAAYAAFPLQCRIILEELPHLASAVRSDRSDAQNPRSKGELFLEEHRALLDSIRAGASGPDWCALGRAALKAFDEAGIGHEDLTLEAGSDAFIDIAANAAAVGITVLDSRHFGVGALRPLTRALRGAALLPYWLLVGLTRGNAMARALAIAGFALGGVLLTLGILGFLGKYSGVGTAAGAATLLTAFGYSALRTGSLLHGVILLGPVAPLAAFVAARRWDDADARDSLATLGVILALAAGMAALGSIPWPLRSPLAWLADPPGRTIRNAAFTVLLLVASGLAAAGTFWLTVLALEHESYDVVADHPVVSGIAVGAVTVTGVGLAYFRGSRLRRWAAGAPLRLPPVDQPSGVAAGWAAVYGTCYLAAACGMVILLGKLGSVSDSTELVLAASVWWAIILGLALLLVAPLLITALDRRDIESRLLADPTLPAPMGVDEFVEALSLRDLRFRFLLEEQNGSLTPTKRGHHLRERIS